MASRYRLVFRGKFLPGLSAAQVEANLAALFQVSPGRIHSLLAEVPAVIKQDIDLEAGNRYLEALAEAGIITHLEMLDAAGALSATAASGGGWDGLERRQDKRRGKQPDRRDVRRSTAIQPDRRVQRGRRHSD